MKPRDAHIVVYIAGSLLSTSVGVCGLLTCYVWKQTYFNQCDAFVCMLLLGCTRLLAEDQTLYIIIFFSILLFGLSLCLHLSHLYMYWIQGLIHASKKFHPVFKLFKNSIEKRKICPFLNSVTQNMG